MKIEPEHAEARVLLDWQKDFQGHHFKDAAALVRLKQRVDPSFSTQALAYLQNSQANVVVKIRIEGDGSVTVIDATGANVLVTNAVRSSMAAWKFTPAMGENGPRCVDTEIPIVISRR